MKIYFDTLWEAWDSLSTFVTDSGIESEEFDGYLHAGGLAYGETSSHWFRIESINGKPARKGLAVQIYRRDSGRYELNMYVS
jgi:hypothetical protein